MTDRERLIELTTTAHKEWLQKEYDHETNKNVAEYLADHLLANGVIVPPCKVGDTVYFLTQSLHTKIEKSKSGKVVRIAITENGIDLFVDNHNAKLPYGKRVFLTKDEAEKALKERKQNDR